MLSIFKTIFIYLLYKTDLNYDIITQTEIIIKDFYSSSKNQILLDPREFIKELLVTKNEIFEYRTKLENHLISRYRTSAGPIIQQINEFMTQRTLSQQDKFLLEQIRSIPNKLQKELQEDITQAHREFPQKWLATKHNLNFGSYVFIDPSYTQPLNELKEIVIHGKDSKIISSNTDIKIKTLSKLHDDCTIRKNPSVSIKETKLSSKYYFSKSKMVLVMTTAAISGIIIYSYTK